MASKKYTTDKEFLATLNKVIRQMPTEELLKKVFTFKADFKGERSSLENYEGEVEDHPFTRMDDTSLGAIGRLTGEQGRVRLEIENDKEKPDISFRRRIVVLDLDELIEHELTKKGIKECPTPA